MFLLFLPREVGFFNARCQFMIIEFLVIGVVLVKIMARNRQKRSKSIGLRLSCEDSFPSAWMSRWNMKCLATKPSLVPQTSCASAARAMLHRSVQYHQRPHKPQRQHRRPTSAFKLWDTELNVAKPCSSLFAFDPKSSMRFFPSQILHIPQMIIPKWFCRKIDYLHIVWWFASCSWDNELQIPYFWGMGDHAAAPVVVLLRALVLVVVTAVVLPVALVNGFFQ